MREEEGEQGRKIIKCERQKKIKALSERSKETRIMDEKEKWIQMDYWKRKKKKESTTKV